MRKTDGTRHGLARVLSKRGICSRTEAARWIAAGRVSVNGRVVVDPEFPIASEGVPILVDGQPLARREQLYLVMNKPRGVVTTASDEKGRDTVYRCLDGSGLPWVAPVGRLDRASEGLLLFSNDPAWAAAITDPGSGPDKTYHVQVDCVPDSDAIAALGRGAGDRGEALPVQSVSLLRAGARNAWLEVVLDEGRNRHIRRLLEAHGIGVLRLVRVSIGPLALGELAKGEWRHLTADEANALAPCSVAHVAGGAVPGPCDVRL